MLNWLTEKVQMPKFVWIGVLLIFVAIAYQIFTAKNLLIDLNDRTLKVAHAERSVAKKEKRVIEIADNTIDHLERLKKDVPEACEHFSMAQMAIREDVKKPLLREKLPEGDFDWRGTATSNK